jgi:hypothetical protein
MRNKFFAVLGVAATLTLAACSSSNEAKPSAGGNTVATGNTAAPVGAPSSNTGNSNTNVMVDGATVALQPVDANLLKGETPDEGIQSPQMQNRLKRKTGDGPAGPPVDVAALAMKLARPAPDDSTFTSYLSEAGYEIRTFRSHPQLKKVEKRTTDDGKVTIKVFLRNGKVIELPGTAIQVLSNAPAFQIMDAAGVSAPATPSQSNPKKGNQ